MTARPPWRTWDTWLRIHPAAELFPLEPPETIRKWRAPGRGRSGWLTLDIGKDSPCSSRE